MQFSYTYIIYRDFFSRFLRSSCGLHLVVWSLCVSNLNFLTYAQGPLTLLLPFAVCRMPSEHQQQQKKKKTDHQQQRTTPVCTLVRNNSHSLQFFLDALHFVEISLPIIRWIVSWTISFARYSLLIWFSVCLLKSASLTCLDCIFSYLELHCKSLKYFMLCIFFSCSSGFSLFLSISCLPHWSLFLCCEN